MQTRQSVNRERADSSLDRSGPGYELSRFLSRGRRLPAVAMSSLSILLCLAALGPAHADPVVTDGDTAFHRVYFLGSGDDAAEDSGLSEDLNSMKAALERGGNHLSLNSMTFTKPSRFILQWAIDSVQANAQPGDAVTIYFGGRGNVDSFRLRSGEHVSASELATMLAGFQSGVSRVILFDSCYGGSFANDIGESAEVAVIGTSTTCPLNPPVSDDFVQTFPEDIAVLAGFGGADADSDQVVTASELRTSLIAEGWRLGEALPGEPLRDGKNKCEGACVSPLVTVTPAECGVPVTVSGEGFSTLSHVRIVALDDAVEIDSTTAPTDSEGRFSGAIVSGAGTLVGATDANGRRDWHVCTGAVPVPDDTAPSCELVAGAGVIDATFLDAEGGLAELVLRSSRNLSVSLPDFVVGTNDPVSFTAVIIDPTRSAYISLKATDIAGNRRYCSKYVRRQSF